MAREEYIWCLTDETQEQANATRFSELFGIQKISSSKRRRADMLMGARAATIYIVAHGSDEAVGTHDDAGSSYSAGAVARGIDRMRPPTDCHLVVHFAACNTSRFAEDVEDELVKMGYRNARCTGSRRGFLFPDDMQQFGFRVASSSSRRR
jgi:hypothetical protein